MARCCRELFRVSALERKGGREGGREVAMARCCQGQQRQLTLSAVAVAVAVVRCCREHCCCCSDGPLLPRAVQKC